MPSYPAEKEAQKLWGGGDESRQFMLFCSSKTHSLAVQILRGNPYESQAQNQTW